LGKSGRTKAGESGDDKQIHETRVRGGPKRASDNPMAKSIFAYRKPPTRTRRVSDKAVTTPRNVEQRGKKERRLIVPTQEAIQTTAPERKDRQKETIEKEYREVNRRTGTQNKLERPKRGEATIGIRFQKKN